ncbi:MAG: IclR family transcriptional regulator [Terriglobales bacterium]|jgi:DNA-binding IclR family transcriptional regulator
MTTNTMGVISSLQPTSKSGGKDRRFEKRPEALSPIASVTRAFNLLELVAFSDRPMSLSEISAELGLAPSTTHRFLRALISLGFVTQVRRSGAYQATLKLFNLGSMVVARFNLSERLLPAMRRIAEQIEEAVSLVFRESLEGILLERVEGGHGVHVFTKYRRVPLYCTAAGKAILSGFDDKSLAIYLSRTPLKRRTPFTLTNATDLKREIEKIRQQGYAVDNQELEVGAKCVAVPLMLTSELMGALSVSALAPRMNENKIREIIFLLKKAIADCGFASLAVDVLKSKSVSLKLARNRQST